jgi:hypothetical protein
MHKSEQETINNHQKLAWSRIYYDTSPARRIETAMLASPERDLGQLFRELSLHDSKGQSCV